MDEKTTGIDLQAILARSGPLVPAQKMCPSYDCDNGRTVLYEGEMPIDRGVCCECKGAGSVPKWPKEATDAINARAADVHTLAAEVERLREEVARLSEREREAATLFRSPDPWNCERRGAYYDAVAAWIAGCRP